MQRTIICLAALALLLPACAPAQSGYGRRRGASAATADSGPYNGPAVTFHGTLRVLTKKDLTIDLDGEDQTLTLRLTKKTKFLQGDQELKPSAIAVGTHLTLDATRDGDQKLSAINVAVSPASPAPSK